MVEYKKGDKSICKNCGKSIYLSGHKVWYHSNDDNDICGANEPINFKRMWDKAEPSRETKRGSEE